MRTEVNIAPLNSIVFIMSPRGGDIPVPTEMHLVLATPSCVVVGTYPEPDGKTRIILTNAPLSEIGPGDALAFDGTLEVRDRVVAVSTVDGMSALSMPVRTDTTHLRVWVNDAQCPDKIVIAAD